MGYIYSISEGVTNSNVFNNIMVEKVLLNNTIWHKVNQKTENDNIVRYFIDTEITTAIRKASLLCEYLQSNIGSYVMNKH